MKKLVVLTLVMMMASLASAALISENVTWTIVGTELIGTGTTLGTVDLNVALSGFGDLTGTLDPDPDTDGVLSDGVNIIAGNAGKVIDNDTYYTLVGGDIEGSDQELGVWYVFDINFTNLGEQTIDLYDGSFGYIGSIPEPMTFALLGLGGLILRRRKK